jgi:hypothetical protein
LKPSEAFARNRAAIRRIAESHRVRNVRVFGSVLKGTDTASSDLDLLVDPTEDTSLFDLAAISVELESLLGIEVDVLTPRFLPDRLRSSVIDEAVPVWPESSRGSRISSITSSKRCGESPAISRVSTSRGFPRVSLSRTP